MAPWLATWRHRKGFTPAQHGIGSGINSPVKRRGFGHHPCRRLVAPTNRHPGNFRQRECHNIIMRIRTKRDRPEYNDFLDHSMRMELTMGAGSSLALDEHFGLGMSEKSPRMHA